MWSKSKIRGEVFIIFFTKLSLLIFLLFFSIGPTFSQETITTTFEFMAPRPRAQYHLNGEMVPDPNAPLLPKFTLIFQQKETGEVQNAKLKMELIQYLSDRELWWSLVGISDATATEPGKSFFYLDHLAAIIKEVLKRSEVSSNSIDLGSYELFQEQLREAIIESGKRLDLTGDPPSKFFVNSLVSENGKEYQFIVAEDIQDLIIQRLPTLPLNLEVSESSITKPSFTLYEKILFDLNEKGIEDIFSNADKRILLTTTIELKPEEEIAIYEDKAKMDGSFVIEINDFFLAYEAPSSDKAHKPLIVSLRDLSELKNFLQIPRYDLGVGKIKLSVDKDGTLSGNVKVGGGYSNFRDLTANSEDWLTLGIKEISPATLQQLAEK